VKKTKSPVWYGLPFVESKSAVIDSVEAVLTVVTLKDVVTL
jgi:hypothetical protein